MTPSVVRARDLILNHHIIIVRERESFLVPSASRPGKLHPVLVHGGRSYCSCEAGDNEVPCTHRLAADYLSTNPGGHS